MKKFKNLISILLLFLITAMLIGCTTYVTEEKDKKSIDNTSLEKLDEKNTDQVTPNEELNQPIEKEVPLEDNNNTQPKEIETPVDNQESSEQSIFINFNINHPYSKQNKEGLIGSTIVHYDNYQSFKERYPNFDYYDEEYFNTKGLIFYSSWEHRPGNHHKVISLTYLDNILTLNVERRISEAAFAWFLPTEFECFVEYEKPGNVNLVKLNLVEKMNVETIKLSDEKLELIKGKIELHDYEKCTIDMLFIVDQVNEDNVEDYINNLLALYNIENYNYSLYDNYLYLFFDIADIDKCLELSKNVETKYASVVFINFYESKYIIS